MFSPSTERKKIVQILNGLHIVIIRIWNDVKNDYSVYVGSKGLQDELKAILHRCEEEENFKFTDKQWEELDSTFELANSQHNDDDAWTDIMFRAKDNFIDSVKAFLGTLHVHLH